jgi:transposase
MRTLTQYEVAWNMHQAGSSIYQITQVVDKHRATVYRWLNKIQQISIRKFLKRKLTAKVRRPKAQTPASSKLTSQQLCSALAQPQTIVTAGPTKRMNNPTFTRGRTSVGVI